MKTLTLFELFERAYGLWMRAAREHFNAVRASELAFAKEWDKECEKRHRQMKTFKQALTKRLQEQEEELRGAKTICTFQFLHPNFAPNELCKYLKEKTNE